MLHFDIVRTQGLEGQVTVDMATKPGTAQTTADVSLAELVPVQVGLVVVAMKNDFKITFLSKFNSRQPFCLKLFYRVSMDFGSSMIHCKCQT